MGSSMIWEIEFEDYKSKNNFRKRVKKILHTKPRIICNHHIKGDCNINIIYDMGYLGYYEIIDFWKNKGDIKIKNLWELCLCDRPQNWTSIKNLFKHHCLEFKK